MRFAVVALKNAEKDKVEAKFKKWATAGLRVLHRSYAPLMWIVSYSGTATDLTDRLWPDGVPEDQYVIPRGVVIRIPKGTDINGWATSTLWEVFDDE